MKNKFRTQSARFYNDEDGVVSIELLLVVPILVWALLSTLVYFDLFHKQTMSIRAGLTLADMFSREQTSVDNAYIDGSQNLLRTLSLPDGDPDLRVSVYYYDEPTSTFRLVWNEVRGTAYTAYTQTTFDDIASRLPALADGDRSILVETRTAYSAPFSIGIGPFMSTDLSDVDFDTFTVVAPRFALSLCYDAPPYGDVDGDKC